MSYRGLCLAALLGGAMVIMGGCAAPGETVQEKQTNIQKMKDETLGEFYLDKPEIKEILKSAPGYAVFKNWNVGLFPGGGGGFGVLVNNSTGQQTYMQMGQFSLGIIFMAKDCRTLLVFDDASMMAAFPTENWFCGGTAEAVFTFDEFGGQTNATGYFGHGIRVYELTENGVSLCAYVPLIQYSLYNELNPLVAPAAAK
jgi:hypothetical protein